MTHKKVLLKENILKEIFMDNKNSIIAVLVLAALLLSLFTFFTSSEWAYKTSARAALLYCPDTSEILYSKNEDLRLPMASTTKIMTALIAIEEGDLDETVVINEAAVGIEGSSAYLKANETYTLRELLYALLLQSANDAAVAIALHISDSINQFVIKMNEKAVAIGAYNTSFKNPSGLDEDGHYTTALDLAKIAAEALKNEHFANIVTTKAKTIQSLEGTIRNFVNHNKLLYKYDNCIGVKTGYTKKSGRCLVGAAEKDGIRLITVTLDAPDDWNDHIKMLDLGFSLRHRVLLLDKNEIDITLPVISGTSDQVKIINKEELYAIIPKTKQSIRQDVILPDYLIAPINEGDTVGEISFYLGDKKIATTSLCLKEGVKYKSKNQKNKR